MDNKRRYLELNFRKQLLQETLKKSEESLNQAGMMLLLQTFDENIKLKSEFTVSLLKTWIKELDEELDKNQFDFDSHVIDGLEDQYKDKIYEIIEFYNKHKESVDLNA